MQVPLFGLLNFRSLYTSYPISEKDCSPLTILKASSVRMIISSALTLSTIPSRLATTTDPESIAVLYSMPVPINGAWGRISGTAWRCWLAPIKARPASSCSKKGIRAAETDTTCFGETSI